MGLREIFIIASAVIIKFQLCWGQQSASQSLVSSIDSMILIQSISVLPATDNLEGIYARPLEQYLIEKIKNNHHWNYRDTQWSGPILSAGDLERDESKVKEMGFDVDALVSLYVSKGPNGVSLLMDLFLKSDGKLFIQSSVNDLKQFDLSSLKEQCGILWNRIIKQIPYQGLVLSRQGLRVTVNLGLRDGVKEGSELNVIQVLQIRRHPKFNFITDTEKEIIGKIKLLKVDETLSFGQLTFEKEKDSVTKGAKISGLEPVSYPIEQWGNSDKSKDLTLHSHPEGSTDDSDPQGAWVPKKPAMFGQVGARVGVSQFTHNLTLNSEGSLSAKNSLAPSVSLEGELWLTPEWTVRARLDQGIAPVKNPRSGSTPEDLSQTLSQMDLTLAYIFYSGGSIWSSKVEWDMGFTQFHFFVDDSEPRGLTSLDYSGFKMGIRGTFPVTDQMDWSAGGYMNYFLNPSLKESPISSGDDNKAAINQFGLLGIYRLKEHIKLEISLDFAVHSAKFSGSGDRGNEYATSTSQRYSGLSAGLFYLF